MPLRGYGDKHKSRRKTADTQRMYAAELGIRRRVNGRKCELIRSLRRTLPLSHARSWTRREEEEENPDERERTLLRRCGAPPRFLRASLNAADPLARFISRARCLSQVRREREFVIAPISRLG